MRSRCWTDAVSWRGSASSRSSSPPTATIGSCDRPWAGCGGGRRAFRARCPSTFVHSNLARPSLPMLDRQTSTATPLSQEIVRAALSASAARLIRSDPVVRLDQDPEGVHQARVATRRLRSDLRTFRSLLDPDWDADLRRELGWLADELGPVRDLDVLGQRLREQVAGLPDGDAGSAPKLLERLRVQREEARAELLSAMREDRYAALLDRVVAAAAAPALLQEVSERRARDVLDELMSGPWRHLELACRGAGTGVGRCRGPPSPDPDQTGSLRIGGVAAGRPQASESVREASRRLAGRARIASGCRRGDRLAARTGGGHHRTCSVRSR